MKRRDEDLQSGQDWIRTRLKVISSLLLKAEQDSSDDGGDYLEQLKDDVKSLRGKVSFHDEWILYFVRWARTQPAFKNFPFDVNEAASAVYP